MSIGARIRQLRNDSGLSQSSFGELCGLTKGAISQWENDDVFPPADKLLEIKKQLKIKKHVEFSLDWIYTGKIDIALEISQSLGERDRKAWIRSGRSYTEQDEGTNGKQ